jgi:predicted TIM-barrel fold metal-dependent hydrolase
VNANDEERDPGLPIKLGRCSNSEYVPPPPSKLRLEMQRRARIAIDEAARKVGMPRRDFMLSLCGAATMLGVMNACAGEARRDGGAYDLPPEAGYEPDAAEEALGGDELVFDVHTHMLDFEHYVPPTEQDARDAEDLLNAFAEAKPCDADPSCFSSETFVREVFLRSDTDLVAMSHVALGQLGRDLLNLEVMERTRAIAAEMLRCEEGDSRVLMHGELLPTSGALGPLIDEIPELASKVVGWKVYTNPATGFPAWYLDDRDPQLPRVGDELLAALEQVGPPVLCVHRGLDEVGEPDPFVDPDDIGPAAARHRALQIVAFHGGWQVDGMGTGWTEGPYDPAVLLGVNRLVHTLDDNGIGPNENVYVDLASAWRELMHDPTQAAHVLGKLLLHVGEDNVLWGTDSIWYGSPQDQIMALRVFEISPELQSAHGYPALTSDIKEKILGLNAARLFGVVPEDLCPIGLAEAEIEWHRRRPGVENRTYGPANARQTREAFLRAHPWIHRPALTRS